MQEFMAEHCKKIETRDNVDTWLYPMLQMGSFGLNQERKTLMRLFQSTGPSDKLYMATAYFNPLEDYIKLMTSGSRSEYHLLTASPQVIVWSNIALKYLISKWDLL